MLAGMARRQSCPVPNCARRSVRQAFESTSGANERCGAGNDANNTRVGEVRGQDDRELQSTKHTNRTLYELGERRTRLAKSSMRCAVTCSELQHRNTNTRARRLTTV